MTNRKKWEAEVAKVNRVSRFWAKGREILFFGGVIITLTLLVLYQYWTGGLSLDIAGIYRIIVTILLGFGVAASLAGIFGSVLASRINTDLLNEAPTADDYKKVVNEIIPKLDTAKEEMQHYLQISVFLLFLNLCKDIIDYFIG